MYLCADAIFFGEEKNFLKKLQMKILFLSRMCTGRIRHWTNMSVILRTVISKKKKVGFNRYSQEKKTHH